MQEVASGTNSNKAWAYSNEVKVTLRGTDLPEITSISPTYALAYQPGLDKQPYYPWLEVQKITVRGKNFD